MQPREFHLLNILLVAVVGFVMYIDLPAAVRLTALIGVIWLTVLLVGPRFFAGKWGKLWPLLAAFVIQQRKHLGLWVAGWLTAHATLAISAYFDSPQELIAQIGERPIIILEMLSLGILILLALLSNNWSRQHIKYWKQIQASVWAIPVMTLISSLVAAHTFLDQLPLLMIAPLLLAACIIVGLFMFIRSAKQPPDWLRFGYMLAGGILAVGILLLQ